MKAAIVYYSGTGGCQKLAKAIHKGMAAHCDAELFYVDKADPKAMVNYDLVVVGGPIWHCRDTVNMRQFTYGMPVMPGKLCAMFASHGVLPVGYFRHVSRVLQKKEMTIIGWNEWYVDVKQVLHMPDPYLTHGHPDEIDLAEAEAFGAELAQRAARILAGETDLIPALPDPDAPMTDLMWKLQPFADRPQPEDGGVDKLNAFAMIPNLRTIDPDKCTRCMACADNCVLDLFDFSGEVPVVKPGCFGCDMCDKLCPEGAISPDPITAGIRSKKQIDMDKCIRCGICEKNCPMHAIDFSTNPPSFTSHCEACDLCWAVCPTGALEITNMEECQGFLSMDDEENPMAKLLDAAEAMGRFRRLLPKDQVGFGNRLMDRTETPRLVVKKDPV